MQPTDGSRLTSNQNYRHEPLSHLQKTLLPGELWQEMLCFLSTTDYLSFTNTNRSFYSMKQNRRYWDAALLKQCPGIPLDKNSFEQYERYRMVYKNIVANNYTRANLPYPKNGSSDDLPAALSTGQKYIATQNESGFLNWFDINTGKEKGKRALAWPIGCNRQTSHLLREHNGHLYSYVSYQKGRATASLLQVICPESNQILFSDTLYSGPTKNPNNELFKIFNDKIYIRENNKTIRAYNTENMNSHEILTDFSKENTRDILGFDLAFELVNGLVVERLHITSSEKDNLIIGSLFDVKSKEIIEEIKTKIFPYTLIKMHNKSTYICDMHEKVIKKIDFDFKNKTTKIIELEGVKPNRNMKFNNNYLFIVEETTGTMTISDIYTGKRLQRIANPTALYNGILFNTVLDVKEDNVTLLNRQIESEESPSNIEIIYFNNSSKQIINKNPGKPAKKERCLIQ